ncbi:glycosyltransferase family 2 protein [Algoriphagus sp. CAU 1675]|uniref:glycosyltransferase family 2 protein n=1 Tax=Algoriphagus sp. CAU 1675 TaxID=3032597 RepID=UPI0023DB517E|nr:glycosyltransferase family 2 protein [Algoriphagus sp. CAU 1675]MDF2159403.1 glycosyltransferase family 2 protein [Algoriphagus sp. CAU 1675]
MISVIIPIYNRGDLIGETLDSLFRQTYIDWECIIIDDGSTDDSENVILNYSNRDSRIKYYKRPSHFTIGANSCRRIGLEYAKGKFVKWLDSDDKLDPLTLEIQLSQIQKGFDVVFCNSLVFNSDFSKVINTQWSQLFLSDQPEKDYLLEKLAWSTPSGLWEKVKINSLQPFSENLPNSQEWIFHLKSLFGNLKIGVFKNDLVFVRSHSNSISYSFDQSYWKNRFISRLIAANFVSKYDFNYFLFVNESLKYMFIKYKIYLDPVLTFRYFYNFLVAFYRKFFRNKTQSLSSFKFMD